MLTKTFNKNYAIIDSLEIDFSAKLNIITGETGAGKSIIVGALGLILGDRADSAVLGEQRKKMYCRRIFAADNKKVKIFLRIMNWMQKMNWCCEGR